MNTLRAIIAARLAQAGKTFVVETVKGYKARQEARK